MPNTSEALIIALLFIAPGLLYELGIEREIGYWRTGLADRTLRFFATSTIIHALAAPATFWLWRSYFAEPPGLSAYSLLPLPPLGRDHRVSGRSPPGWRRGRTGGSAAAAVAAADHR